MSSIIPGAGKRIRSNVLVKSIYIYHLFMVILGMVYEYFTHIIDNTCKRQQTEDCGIQSSYCKHRNGNRLDQLDQPQFATVQPWKLNLPSILYWYDTYIRIITYICTYCWYTWHNIYIIHIYMYYICIRCGYTYIYIYTLSI